MEEADVFFEEGGDHAEVEGVAEVVGALGFHDVHAGGVAGGEHLAAEVYIAGVFIVICAAVD